MPAVIRTTVDAECCDVCGKTPDADSNGLFLMHRIGRRNSEQVMCENCREDADGWADS